MEKNLRLKKKFGYKKKFGKKNSKKNLVKKKFWSET